MFKQKDEIWVDGFDSTILANYCIIITRPLLFSKLLYLVVQSFKMEISSCSTFVEKS